ncbi:hypothetical protein DYB38_010882 [Aphanomyces astaci]|uniref:CLASP N-terminal domain-containing protein n=1 Tax=Aphanomyces astaci TaxID=112090 RepID=A0A397EAC3_APHAT|nr:hypothetical protein DYB38_010882 [Aphanomyces astaci]
MGDSKLPSREAATDLLLVFMDKLGMSSMMDRLKLCAGHKNWRTREQILVAILLAMQRFRGDPNRLCRPSIQAHSKHAHAHASLQIWRRRSKQPSARIDSPVIIAAVVVSIAPVVPAQSPGAIPLASFRQPPPAPCDIVSRRCPALQQLQRVVASGGAFHAGFAPSLRALREPLCEQVGDLRSTVAREACATITALASALTGDDSWAHLVEFFVAALLKATYVTIQVISTSADACIKSIIQSGRGGGYVKALAKFIEGVRARNQVLRLHCVEYVTLALTCWHVTVLDK